MKAKFIVFEGIDGSGKSTQASLLHKVLKEKNINSILTYEPTDKNHGKKIRDSFSGERFSKEEELRLFTLDRKEHLNEIIIPSLNHGKHVILDRYYYSTAAYQGASGFDYKNILKEQCDMFIKPDICFFLDIDVNISSKRIMENRGHKNAFEEINYLDKVYKIFKNIDSDEIIHIDASESESTIHKNIMQIVFEIIN